jgi:pre-mRNA-splicing factor ATP-dependent RNA helicase DHX38/PRP16
MDPSLAKLVIESSQTYRCSEEMVTIVSMLSVPSVFYRPKERLEESDAAREKFFVHDSDHLTLLTVYQQWMANGRRDGWCVKHFLHPKALRRAQEIRNQISDIMKSNNMELVSCGYDLDVVRECICSGYYHQAAKRKGLGEYINLRTAVSVQLHPTSALYNSGDPPDYVVYHELILTSKEYMSCVTAVDPHWLADLGGVFYSVKEKGFSAKGRREIEYSKREELERGIAADRAKQKADAEKERIGTNGAERAKTGVVKTASASKGSAVVRPVIKGKKR